MKREHAILAENLRSGRLQDCEGAEMKRGYDLAVEVVIDALRAREPEFDADTFRFTVRHDLDRYRAIARAKAASDDIDVDSDARVIVVTGTGAMWVSAWIFLSPDDLGHDQCADCQSADARSTYCGSFCDEHFAQHVKECSVCNE